VTYIEKYIKHRFGELSGELIEHICQTEGITNEAARKRVERLKSPLHKVKGIFSDNQSFVYHSQFYNTPSYFEKLEEAIAKSSKQTDIILNALRYNGGAISKLDLPNFSSNPVANIRGHVTLSTLIPRLLNIGIIQEYGDDYFILHPSLLSSVNVNFPRIKALEVSRKILLHQFSEWSRNLGLTSYNTGKFNGAVGGFQFGFTSPSYISGFVTWKDGKPNPGFLVCDVLLGKSVSIENVEFFTRKTDSIQSANKSTKLMPVVVINNSDNEALDFLKRKGVIVAQVKSLFGEEYTELLEELIEVITNAGAVMAKEPDKFISLMNKITKLVDGKTLNLKGDLFEFAVAYYFSKNSNYIEVGVPFHIEQSGKTWDADVISYNQQEIKIIECKGYSSPLGEEYVSRYLREIIPDIKKKIAEKHPKKRIIFELWCTGGYTEGAIELLEAAKDSTKKYGIDFLDKERVIQTARSLDDNKFKKILEDYFID
jgi:hypothetical protein